MTDNRARPITRCCRCVSEDLLQLFHVVAVALEHLKAKGVQMVGEPFETQGNRLCFFNDGDGNLVHLIKREKPLP